MPCVQKLAPDDCTDYLRLLMIVVTSIIVPIAHRPVSETHISGLSAHLFKTNSSTTLTVIDPYHHLMLDFSFLLVLATSDVSFVFNLSCKMKISASFTIEKTVSAIRIMYSIPVTSLFCLESLC